MRIFISLLAVCLVSACTALVMGGSTSGGYQAGTDEREPPVVAADSTITTQIEEEIVADSVVNVFNIDVGTYEGTVTLTGTVGSYVARDQAHQIAKSTKGVVVVNNLIVVDDKSGPN